MANPGHDPGDDPSHAPMLSAAGRGGPESPDAVAVTRWQQGAPPVSPWLHEEVAQRMQQRLDWMLRAPRRWCHWQPVRGGLAAHALLRQRYPRAECVVYEPVPRHAQALEQDARPWRPWRRQGPLHFAEPQPGSLDMLWANMALHHSAQPQALLARWQQALAADGYVMFSCLGPDTLRELHALYARLGWPPPGPRFVDMHDWGDLLLQAGFADPVMDMERITLTFATPGRLLQELRELGRNTHPQRLERLRPRAWRETLHRGLEQHLRGADGQLALTFEIIYGHASKAPPQVPVRASSSVSLHDMRRMLRDGRKP